MAGRRKGKNTVYSYTRLKDLNGGKRVNVVGVVSSFMPAHKISNGFMCSLTLMDESRLEVDCSMFHTLPESLPPYLYPGDILCLRHGATEGLAPHVALKVDTHGVWIIFRKKDGYKQLACSMTHQLSAKSPEMGRVEELKKWSMPDNIVASPADVTSTPVRQAQQSSSASLRSSPRLSRQSTPTSQSSHTPSKHTSPRSRDTPLSARAQFSHQSLVHSPLSKVTESQVSRPYKPRFYDTQLTTISNLVVGSKDSAVIGVVKYFKPPVQSKGSDYYTSLCITDDSMADFSLTCVLFNPTKELLPVVCTCGEVVMLKGLTISFFEGVRQAMGHQSTLVGIFPLDIASPSPTMIGNFYNMKECERRRLQQLRSWAASTNIPLFINSRMEEISLSNYCSTVCLVLAVLKPFVGTSGVVLVVTDGTVPKYCLGTGTDGLSPLSVRPSLYYAYHSLASIVHVRTASRPMVSAGDVVQLINLHMVEVVQDSRPFSVTSSSGQADSTSELLTVDLLLEDHERYQGAVKVHPPDGTVESTFKDSLPILEGPCPVWKTVDSSLAISTVILDGNIRQSTLAQVQQSTSAVGSTHVVEVQVVGVGRRAWSCLEDMTQLRCPVCMTRYLTPQPCMENYNELLTAGDPCVCCGEEGGEGVALCYMYAFPLLVEDHTSKLEVAVSGSEGCKFMPRNPVNLYSDSSAKEYLLNLLYLLTGGNDPFHHVPLGPFFSQPRPTIKICVTVIITCSGQRRYKVTSTSLQVDEV